MSKYEANANHKKKATIIAKDETTQMRNFRRLRERRTINRDNTASPNPGIHPHKERKTGLPSIW